MKTILFISHSSSLTGGGEEDFLKLLIYFHKKYNICTVFPPGGKSIEFIENSDQYLEVKGTVFPFTKFRFKAYIGFFYRNFNKIFQIYNFIKKYGPFDLCFINSSVCFLEVLPVQIFKIPYILSVKEKINPAIISKLIYFFYKKTALKILTISKFLQAIIINQTGRKDVKVIYSTIDEKYFDRIKFDSNIKKQNQLNKKFRIVNIGSIFPNKGQHLLIEALSLIDDNNIYIDYFGKIVDEKYYKNLNGLIKDNNISNRVSFKGEIKKEELIKEIINSDVVVITSKEEGQSIVLLEGLYLEKPVITTKVGIANEIIIDGENGLLYDYSDINKLSGLIVRLKKDKEFYNNIRLNCRSTYKRNFDSESGMKQYDDVFVECMK